MRKGGREEEKGQRKEQKTCFERKHERKGTCLRKRRRKATVMSPFRLLLT